MWGEHGVTPYREVNNQLSGKPLSISHQREAHGRAYCTNHITTNQELMCKSMPFQLQLWLSDELFFNLNKWEIFPNRQINQCFQPILAYILLQYKEQLSAILRSRTDNSLFLSAITWGVEFKIHWCPIWMNEIGHIETMQLLLFRDRPWAPAVVTTCLPSSVVKGGKS